jgi:uncharacterized protein (TIGR03083 family)
MKQLEPVLVVDLFPEERTQLLGLLLQLSDEEWSKPTVCTGWSVKDVASHLLGVDIGVLSRKRDGFRIAARIDDWSELLTYLNRQNELWVQAARRISPRLLVDLLRFTGDETQRYFESLDLFAIGEPVSWAGPDPAPVWLDIAREYTERWLHQQHIRDAVNRPGLKDRRFFAPVLEAFVRALPHTFRDVEAADGAQVKLVVSGEAGGEWSVAKQGRGWLLGTDAAGTPDSVVAMDQETAWRLFTRGLDKRQASDKVSFEGDRSLGMRVLDTVSIIA